MGPPVTSAGEVKEETPPKDQQLFHTWSTCIVIGTTKSLTATATTWPTAAREVTY